MISKVSEQRRIFLAIAEASLETIPREIANHPSVINHARRLGRKPSEILLDRSYHHAAMKSLKFNWKRGRPDLVHFLLMEALATPLYHRGILKVYLHTTSDKVIDVAADLRIPKSYFRFEGLIMDLFMNKVITASKKEQEGEVSRAFVPNPTDVHQNGPPRYLLKLHENMSFEEMIKKLVMPRKVIGLSTSGIETNAEDLVTDALKGLRNPESENNRLAFVVGGFPKGHFSESISRNFNFTYSLGNAGLEAHVVVARILYECEKALSVS